MDSKTQKRYAAAIKSTVSTPGWKYIEDVLKLERQQLLEKAVTDRDNTHRLLDAVEAIDLLLKKVNFYASIDTKPTEPF